MSARKQQSEQAWERVLVRHILPAKRKDLYRISSLLRTPFSSSSSSSDGGSQGITISEWPRGRWMIAAQFAGESWMPLFSNAATARQLFEVHASSRRLEVAWIGCQPETTGWLFRLNRGGNRIVEFAQAARRGSAPTFQSTDLKPNFLRGCKSGEQAIQRLCAYFEISLPVRQIRATEREFQILGLRGKPVKTGLRGYVYLSGPEIAGRENKAATALAKAIEGCDVEGIRAAIACGAPLHVLPDTHSSPLLSALYRCDRPGWKECVEVLIDLGCPINGIPPDDPPVLDCVQSFVREDHSLKMVKFLLAHGADVNATDRHGQTALYEAVVQGRMDLVRLLLEHGADPTIRTSQGMSVIEWLQWRVNEELDRRRQARHGKLLRLLTGGLRR